MPFTGPGHRPAQRAEELWDLFAIIFGCAGSRLTALIFEPGLGDAGVVRSAGHVIDYVVLGSFEPGVSALNIPMTVVLGPPIGADRPTRIQVRDQLLNLKHATQTAAGVLDSSPEVSADMNDSATGVISVSDRLHQGRAELV